MRTQALPSEEPVTPETLAGQLRDPSREVRLAAVRELEALGPAGIRHLEGALRVRCYHTRFAAVEALGRVGDAGSLEALRRAMHEWTKGSGLFQWSYALGIPLVPLLMIAVACHAGTDVGLWGVAGALIALNAAEFYFGRRGGEPLRLYLDAIARIAERFPEEDHRRLAGYLRATSYNALLQSRATRAACREALSVLKRAGSLPRPAEAVDRSDPLPLPAEPPSPAPEGLPRV